MMCETFLRILNAKHLGSKLHRKGSAGVESAILFLNEDTSQQFLTKLAANDKNLKEEMDRLNFWTGNNFVIKRCNCIGSEHALH